MFTNDNAALEILFFATAIAVFFCYFSYPIFVIILSFLKKNKNIISKNVDIQLDFSIVFSTYNNGKKLEEKLNNLIESLIQFPHTQIYIVSDGSTDNTNQILKTFSDAHENINIFLNTENSGKNNCLNQMMSYIESEVIVFTDADTHYDKNAFRLLVDNFSDKTIGAVIGNLSYIKNNEVSAINDQQYWNFEKSLKLIESKAGILFAGNGALFAGRKKLIGSLEPGIPNDLQTPIEILNKGYKVVYCQDAKVFEKISSSRENEFKRRTRTINRGMKAVVYLNKKIRSRIWWLLFFRKVPRWLAAFLYPLLFIINIMLLGSTAYDVFFSLQTSFYLLAVLGLKFKMKGPLSLPSYFLIINLASITAFTQLCLGKSYTSWEN